MVGTADTGSHRSWPGGLQVSVPIHGLVCLPVQHVVPLCPAWYTPTPAHLDAGSRAPVPLLQEGPFPAELRKNTRLDPTHTWPWLPELIAPFFFLSLGVGHLFISDFGRTDIESVFLRGFFILCVYEEHGLSAEKRNVKNILDFNVLNR